MRVHLWSDVPSPIFRPPPMVFKEDGMVMEFHDYPKMYDMQIGDLIHYHTHEGVGVFRVEEILPADLANYPADLLLVRARKQT